MREKVAAAAIAALFIAMLVPTGAIAGYSLAISGRSDFTATPFVAQEFGGPEVYVRVYLSETSQSSLLITIETDGDLGQFITFPEFSGEPSFTLYPGQNRKVLYNLSFPASAPGRYGGSILAVGNPPAGQTDNGTGAIGKPVAGITLAVDVPSEVQVSAFATARPGGFPDRQWSSWGDGWATQLTIVNGGTGFFNGSCNLTLAGESGLIDRAAFNITNLSVAGTVDLAHSWPNGLALDAAYGVTATIYTDAWERKEEESMAFAIPSPAEILSVSKSPDLVFSTDTAEIYATAASTDAALTLHWYANNGTETASAMVYASGEYSAAIAPQAMTSTVYYWITSANGAFTDREPAAGAYSYYVFSPDVPDLALASDGFFFTPFDPRNETMNETDQTNIYITVRNLGRGDADGVTLRVYDNETPIWNTTIGTLAGDGGSYVVRFNWKPLQGAHILRFELDPDGAILDLDEDNNYYTLDEVTIGAAPPPEPETPVSEPLPLDMVLASIIVPLVLALLIILFLRRKKTINVTVTEVKLAAQPRGGKQWAYTCSCGESVIGTTMLTDVQAEIGDVLKVRPERIRQKPDGTLAWYGAEVVDKAKKADDEKKVRKLAEKQ